MWRYRRGCHPLLDDDRRIVGGVVAEAQTLIWQGMMMGVLALIWLIMLATSLPREPRVFIYGRALFVLLLLCGFAMITSGGILYLVT